jgi:hypothetical protein
MDSWQPTLGIPRASRGAAQLLPLPGWSQRAGTTAMRVKNTGIFSCITVSESHRHHPHSLHCRPHRRAYRVGEEPFFRALYHTTSDVGAHRQRPSPDVGRGSPFHCRDMPHPFSTRSPEHTANISRRVDCPFCICKNFRTSSGAARGQGLCQPAALWKYYWR